MIAGAAEALAASLQSADGRQVRYLRGSEGVLVTAVPGQTTFETANNIQIIEQIQTRDFLIVAASIVLSGAVTLPASGDVIEEIAPDVTYRYEVRPPAEGIKPYRFCDTARTLLRVHTKQVA